MTPELFWLTLTAILAASLWIPYIVGVNMYLPAEIDPFQRMYDHGVLPDWVQRAYRAHLNLLEQMLPFAVVVLVAHMAGVSTLVTVWASALFFWLRVAHAVGMITAWTKNPARPIIFTAGWVCILAIAVQVLIAA